MKRESATAGIVLVAAAALVSAAMPGCAGIAASRTAVTVERCPEGGTNLVQNGDFESSPGRPPYRSLSAGASMGAWSIVAGAVDLVDSSFWSPAEGRHSLDLDGSCGAGIIRQAIGADSGRSYLLCYALSGNPGGAPAVKTLEVWWGGVRVDSVRFDAGAASFRTMMWTRRQVVFTASGRTVPLEFRSLTDGCYGPVLDEISLRELSPPLP